MSRLAAEDELVQDVLLEDTLVDGRTLARVNGRAVFVQGGVPGDVVTLTLYRGKGKQWLGRIVTVQQASNARTQPCCQHFGSCGGCQWQHMRYEAQLEYKQKQVVDALTRIGHLQLPGVRPILGCEQSYHYRNKLEFSFANRRYRTRAEMEQPSQGEEDVLGFHAPGVFDKVLDIEECWLQDSRVNEVRNAVRDEARRRSISFYDAKAHTGLLRTLIFRTSRATGEFMVVLCLAEENEEVVTTLFNHLAECFPYITSYLTIINPKLNDSYTDLPWHSWRGADTITEKLGGYEFAISPVSFFQTNSAQAERLYQVVKEFMPVEEQPLVYDLYCGTGSIGIFISALAKRVVGIEYTPAAVLDANRNAMLNGLKHLSFLAGDIAKVLNESFVQTHGKPSLVITDPPRAGMDARVVQQLLLLAPKQIIYVSCNPATQARDLALMASHYQITAVQPVDMFPHTTHVENVVLLQLN